MGQWLQVLSGLAAVAAAGLLSYRAWTAPSAAKPAPAVYAPVTARAPAAAPATRGNVHVTEAPANGFILVVETVPDGAELWVNDVLNGATPASVNFDCHPGAGFRLVLKHDGFAPIAHEVTCRKDVMLIVNARLDPLRKR
jgi:hypothetical protein